MCVYCMECISSGVEIVYITHQTIQVISFFALHNLYLNNNTLEIISFPKNMIF